MNVLQHTKNELNLCLKQNRPDRSYRDTLLIFVGVSGRNSKNNGLRTSALFFSSPRVALRARVALSAKYLVRPAWLTRASVMQAMTVHLIPLTHGFTSTPTLCQVCLAINREIWNGFSGESKFSLCLSFLLFIMSAQKSVYWFEVSCARVYFPTTYFCILYLELPELLNFIFANIMKDKPLFNAKALSYMRA